ncbi:ankyrin repeat-containing protein YCR051W-like [Panicum virgatum]|uniref:ankyrin repeat-containing protein YCR051W-like n=1 Tax=Panicum virgatum TaxID=38727 RepID=UPI0019D590BC|nr:ankyrin repeat-containing protein YCR051W-like [Panicum virgatum]
MRTFTNRSPKPLCRPPVLSANVHADEDALFSAATNNDLGRLKGIVETLGERNGDRASVLSLRMHGYGVLHCAASYGHLEVYKYLMEELGGDANMTGADGVTVLMASAQPDDLSTVKYFLDHGGDLMKAEEKGGTVLHHALKLKGN